MNCVIKNAHCVPRTCMNCAREFCPHERPDRRSFGWYGQYCSPECSTSKQQLIFALGSERFSSSRIVLLVEEIYCYLVLNKKDRYAFQILHEHAPDETGKLDLDYCHYPGFSTEDHPVTFAMKPRLQIALTVKDEHDASMWTIVGFRVLDGEIDTYGVGGHIEVIDLRKQVTV